MNNMLNVTAAEGILTSEVKLTYDDVKKTSIAKFYLKNTTTVGKNTYNNDFYVVVYGRKAEACAKHLHIGKKCSVSGKISTWHKTDKNGNSQPGITLIASDVNFEEEEDALEEDKDALEEDN